MRALSTEAKPQLDDTAQSAQDAAMHQLQDGSHSGPAYLEEGSFPLQIGVLEYEVPFSYQKVTADLRFDRNYVDDPNNPPQDIRVVIMEVTRFLMKIRLSGAPTHDDLLWRWKVEAPGALEVTLATPPRYILDEEVVHTTGDETIEGKKTFEDPLGGPLEVDGQIENLDSIDPSRAPYNVDMTGVTDSTAGLLAAIAAAIAQNKSRVVLPTGTVKISSLITIGNGSTSQISTIGNNLELVGTGGAYNSFQAGDKGTTIIWAGATNGTMFKILGPIRGVRVKGILFDGGTIAGTGIDTAMNCYGRFEDVWVKRVKELGWYIHTMIENPPNFTNGANGMVYDHCGVSEFVNGGDNPTGILVGEEDSGGATPDPIFQTWIQPTVRMDGITNGIGLHLRYADGGEFLGGVFAAHTPLKVTATAAALGLFPSAISFYNTEIYSSNATGIVVVGIWNPQSSINFWPWNTENGQQHSVNFPNHHGFKGISDIGQPVGSQPYGRITCDTTDRPSVANISTEVMLAFTSTFSVTQPTLYPGVLYRKGDTLRVRMTGFVSPNTSGSNFVFRVYIGDIDPTNYGLAKPEGYHLLGTGNITTGVGTGNQSILMDVEFSVNNRGTPTAQQVFASGILIMGGGLGSSAGAFDPTSSPAFDSTPSYRNVLVTIDMPDALSAATVSNLSVDVVHSVHSYGAY